MSELSEADTMRTLGRTGLQVSPVTLGTSYLGDPAQPDGSPAPEGVALALALLTGQHAVVDTSNAYAQGRSETALGLAIRRHGLPRGHVVVTKADADPVTGRFDRDRIWRSFEESTSRLGLDRLPLLHLHDPYTITVAEALAPGGAVEGLVELRDQGLVDAIGVAAGEISMMSAYVRSGVFDAVLTHNRYTLVDRSAEALMAEARDLGMGVFNAAPFGGGLLAGHGTRYAYRESSPALLAWLEQARQLCDAWSLQLPTVALHFSLRSSLVDSTVVGVNRPERITQLQQMILSAVPDQFWPELDGLGNPPSTVDD